MCVIYKCLYKSNLVPRYLIGLYVIVLKLNKIKNKTILS